MNKTNYLRKVVAFTLGSLILFAFQSASASEKSLSFKLSVLSSLQVKNDVQIPNTDLGTRFSLQEAAGEGPVTSARLEFNWMVNQRHGVRVLLAPLTLTDTVMLKESVLFFGESFSAEQETEATYRFNSWRIGYHYLLRQGDKGSLRVGATLKVRDAEIRLEQGETISAKENVGLVPLLYVAGQYRLGNGWTVGADLDGLAGGPGRAIDLGVAMQYALGKRWQIGAELRLLDGGADTEEVYNFAQFNSAALTLSTGF